MLSAGAGIRAAGISAKKAKSSRNERLHRVPRETPVMMVSARQPKNRNRSPRNKQRDQNRAKEIKKKKRGASAREGSKNLLLKPLSSSYP